VIFSWSELSSRCERGPQSSGVPEEHTFWSSSLRRLPRQAGRRRQLWEQSVPDVVRSQWSCGHEPMVGGRSRSGTARSQCQIDQQRRQRRYYFWFTVLNASLEIDKEERWGVVVSLINNNENVGYWSESLAATCKNCRDESLNVILVAQTV